jgi:hypothetical protein
MDEQKVEKILIEEIKTKKVGKTKKHKPKWKKDGRT